MIYLHLIIVSGLVWLVFEIVIDISKLDYHRGEDEDLNKEYLVLDQRFPYILLCYYSKIF